MTERWDYIPPWPPTRAERLERTMQHWARQVITQGEHEAKERLPLDLIACETYPGYRNHLREIGDTPPHYGGHVKKPLSLCGRPVAWDTHVPVDGFDECQRCVAQLERERRERVKP